MPGPMQGVFCRCLSFILTTSLLGSYHYYQHFNDEEMKEQKG